MTFVSTKSPLELPHIIEQIAYNLPLQDIRSCRLVNKLWSQEMERHLKLRLTVCVDGSNLSEALQMLERKRLGFDISIHNVIFKNGITSSNKVFRSVFFHFGHTLSSLVISGLRRQFLVYHLHQILTELAPSLEKLVFLDSRECYQYLDSAPTLNRKMTGSMLASLRRIKGVTTYPKMKVLEWDEGGPIDIVDIYVLFPNLKTVKIVKANFKQDDEIIPELKHWRSLKYFEFHTEELKSVQFVMLKRLRLNLLQFVMRFSAIANDDATVQDCFTEFIGSISETLIRLDIRLIPIRFIPKFDMKFPYMPKLLRLKIYSSSVSPFDLRNLWHMPKLKALSFSFCSCPGEEDFSIVPNSFESLKIVLEHKDVLLKSCSVQFLMRLTLHPFQISDDIFREIVIHCKLLIKLEISFDTFVPQCFPCDLLLTDSGITGIPQEELDKLEGENEDSEVVSSLRKHPWIGSLKQLKHIYISGTTSKLTKKSLLYGMNHVTTLHHYGILTDTLDFEKTGEEKSVDTSWDCNCDHTCERCTNLLLTEFDMEDDSNRCFCCGGYLKADSSNFDELDERYLHCNENPIDQMRGNPDNDSMNEANEFFWPAVENSCHIDEEYFRFIYYIMEKYNSVEVL